MTNIDDIEVLAALAVDQDVGSDYDTPGARDCPEPATARMLGQEPACIFDPSQQALDGGGGAASREIRDLFRATLVPAAT
jgi:hypothetical protein